MNLTGKLKREIRKKVLEQLPNYKQALELKEKIAVNISEFLINQLNDSERELLREYPCFIKHRLLPSLDPKQIDDEFLMDIKLPPYREIRYSWDSNTEYECGEVFRVLVKKQSDTESIVSLIDNISDLKSLDSELYNNILTSVRELCELLVEVNIVMIKIDTILNADFIDLPTVKKDFKELYDIIIKTRDENK